MANDMENVQDYAANATGTITPDTYNEEDAFVFSTLSYIPFEQVPGFDQSKDYTVGEFAQLMLENYDQIHYNSPEYGPDYRTFLENIQNNERYSDCVITNMAAENETSQWAGLAIEVPNGDFTVAAFRGTNGTEMGWAEDFQLAYDLDGTEAQRLSAEFIQGIDGDIALAGHSKGGNDAIAAFLMSDSELRDRVFRIDNFDGPGVTGEFALINGDAYLEIGDVLHSYFPQDSVIGQLLMDMPGERTYISATQDYPNHEGEIMWEHYVMCWQFEEGNSGFSETDQSALSKYINNVADDAIFLLPITTQYQVVDMLEQIGFFDAFTSGDWSVILKNLPEYFMRNGALGFAQDMICLAQALGAALLSAAWEGLKLGIKYVAEKLGEILTDICDKIKEKISEFVDGIIDTMNDIYDKITEFCDHICDFLSNVVDGFSSFMQSIGNWLTGTVVIDEAHFYVNCAQLSGAADDISNIISTIDSLVSQIGDAYSDVRSNMDFAFFPRVSSAQGDLEDASSTMAKLRQVLDNSVSTYETTENSVKSKF